MNDTIVIASRELRERSRVFLMAAAFAVLPFLMALIPAARNERPETIAATAGFLAVALALGVALAQGSSTIAGELVARRMSFYFTKPVSAAAIWFGKMIAAMLTSAVCFVIVIGPALLVTGSSQWQRTFGGTRLLGLLGVSMVVLFLISHTLSTMVRSRSGLIGIDFVCAAAAIMAMFYIVRPVIIGSPYLWKTLLSVIAVAIVAILIAAPVWQLARGRSDIRRSHAALSRALWTSLAIVLLVAAAYVAWLVRVAPTDVNVADIEQAPGGNGVFINGIAPMRGEYFSSFLADARTGRYTRIAAPVWSGVGFARNGSIAGWLQPASLLKRNSELELYTKRLDQPDSEIQATGIRKGAYGGFVFSPDGSRVAVLKDTTISVHELGDRHRIVASASHGERADFSAMFFADRDVVRLYQSPLNSTSIDIYDLDTRTKKFVKTGSVDGQSHSYPGLRASPDGARILLARIGVLADGRTGALIAKLPVTTQNSYGTGFLSDGSVVVIKRIEKGRSLMHHFAADGTKLREISLPTHYGWLTGQLENGKVIVLDDETVRDRKMIVVDVARGTIERVTNGLRGPGPNWGDYRLSVFRNDQLFVASNADGKLVTWNASTGEIKPFPRM